MTKKLEINKKLENKLEIYKNLEIKLEIYKNLEIKLEIYSYFKLEIKLEIFEFFVNGRWSQYEFANSSLEREGSFWVLWGPWGFYPKFDLARFLSYILVMTYPKIISLALVVSEEIGV